MHPEDSIADCQLGVARSSMRGPLVRPLPVAKMRPHNTALLIVDMERDFVAEGAVQETPGGRALIPTINQLTAWARRHGVPVVFTFEAHRADHSDYGIELESPCIV